MGRSGVDIMQTQNSGPDAILRQAVAVIDKTKTMVATTIGSAIGAPIGN